jgi:hypothetical protein
MIKYIENIKDVMGNYYIGVNIYTDTVYPFLEQLKDLLEDEYDEYVKYQQQRDMNHYHITVIRPIEISKLEKQYGLAKFREFIEHDFEYPIDDIQLLGIGKAESGSNKAFFIVVRSEKIQAIRKNWDLEPIDLHITIGFKYRDVFSVSKNQVLKIDLVFTKLFKKYYYDDNENFDWIKYLQNYNGEEDYDVKIINIKDTSARFRIGNKHYCEVVEAGGDLIIGAIWYEDRPDSEIPILSKTILNSKLKKNV